mgnify:CR=1 FL=1
MSDILINIPFTELCKIEGIERELVVDVVEYGIVEPIGYVVDERVMEGRMVGQAEEGHLPIYNFYPIDGLKNKFKKNK